MDSERVLKVLQSVGAIINNSHLVYTSGKHGDTYVNKDAVYPHVKETSVLCLSIAEQFARDEIQAVVGPAMGGIILSQWTAHHLSILTGREVLAAYADKGENGSFIIRRGYDKLICGKRVLVVEDVLTTGGSARKTIKAVRDKDGSVIGLGVLCNRGGIVPREVGDVPKLVSLVNVRLESWPENDCVLCKRGVPINTSVGKGAEFVVKRGQGARRAV